jgi:2-(3-amino-3-carboxypropyl)histidine synthase
LVYHWDEKKIGLRLFAFKETIKINEGKILKIPGYNIDLEKAVKIIKENKYTRVVLQVPEGLKFHFSKFVEFLENKTNANIIISADPCFGACDSISSDFKDLGIDFVVQIGHTVIPNIKDYPVPIIFVNAKADIDVLEVIKKAIPFLNGKKIGIVTTAQHVHFLDDASKILKNNNFIPVIGKGDGRIESEGQILGCNFSAATSIASNVDLFLFIGNGNFHPLGLLLSTKKPVIVCDPYTSEIRGKELEDLKNIVLRQRYGAIARSKDANVFGILVGRKIGQQRIDLAYKIKEKLKIKQKKSYILTANYFLPAHLESFRGIDCFVSTACPRIAIDDYMQYKIPILTPFELDVLLGFKKWDDYRFDEILDQ